MSDQAVLEAHGLVKTFQGTKGPIQVLKGLNLTVRRGDVISIEGASGVGKSTLLQILGSLDHADEGYVTLQGRRVDSIGGRELNALRNKVIGFVFQFHYLLPEFDAIENVLMPGLIGGASWGPSAKRAQELLERVGLGERLYHKPGELSGGEQQRVAVARALANDADVVLADEPTGNLDEGSSEELHELVRRLSDEEQKTFVVVTHKKELSRYADRVLVLKDGVLHVEKEYDASSV